MRAHSAGRGFAPEGVDVNMTSVGAAHDADYGQHVTHKGTHADRDFAAAMFRWFAKAMGEGRFSGHPYEVRGGLEAVGKALRDMEQGKNRALKYVYRVSDEK